MFSLPRMQIAYKDDCHIPLGIIEELRAGSHDAFRVVFDHYYERLLRYAATICYTGEQAEDVVQEVFISLWEHRTTLTEPEVTGWLIHVCRNKSIKSLRRKIFLIDISDVCQVKQPNSDALEKLHYQDVEKRIAQVIAALPPTRKKIFLLSRESNMSYQQIAEQLGISVKTVEAQMSSALREVRSQVTPFAYITLMIFLRQY